MSQRSSKWEQISHVATFTSTIAAILAIIIGVHQFNVSTEKTEKQIAYLDEDKRPYLLVDHTKVTLWDDERFTGSECWSYDLILKNVGIRAASNVRVTNYIISVSNNGDDQDFSKYEYDNETEEYANPVSKEGTIETGHLTNFGKYSYYYIKAIIGYNDINSNKSYNDTFYYSLFLDSNIREYVDVSQLHPLELGDAKRLDTIINKEYFHDRIK